MPGFDDFETADEAEHSARVAERAEQPYDAFTPDPQPERPEGPFVLVVGAQRSEWRFHGPFATLEDAADWALNNTYDSWWVSPIMPPTDTPETVERKMAVLDRVRAAHRQQFGEQD